MKQEMTGSTGSHAKQSPIEKTIALYANQLYKLYPQYGGDGSDIKTIIRAFQFSLKEYPLETVEKGFHHWMNNENKMPLPSDIRVYCVEREKHKRLMLDVAPSRDRLLVSPVKANIVPWYGLSYQEALRDHERALNEHVAELKETSGKDVADNYIKYLKGLSK